jgi:hypothetical protein
MSNNDTTIHIPVGLDAQRKVIDATLYLPAPMTRSQWSQMLAVLDAMKPVLVEDSIGIPWSSTQPLVP